MVPAIYAFPGLGTDGRLYTRLRRELPLQVIEWELPAPGESLPAYAARLGEAIPPDSEPILLGVSLGGIVARELARQRPCRLVIQLSSLASPAELPPAFRLFRHVPLYHLSRGSWRYRTLPLWVGRFGVQAPAEQQLLQDMFRGFSDRYRMWAIHQLVHWPGGALPVPSWRYHGDRDQVFPWRWLQGAIRVPGANHFMVYQQGEALGRRLRERLQAEGFWPET